MADKTHPTPEQLKALLDYDAETGLLTWKARQDEVVFNARWSGRSAGAVNKGHVVLKVLGHNYFAHRIIWAMAYDAWPTHLIDHINRVRDDNRLCNLRQVDAVGNARNSSIRSNNTSGYAGACFNKKLNKWEAKICLGGRSKHLGLFASAQEAYAVYAAAKQIHHPVVEV